MKIAVMEKSAVTKGDVDFTPLEKLAEIVYYDGTEYSQLKDAVGDADGVIVNKSRVDAALMDACPNLKYVKLLDETNVDGSWLYTLPRLAVHGWMSALQYERLEQKRARVMV